MKKLFTISILSLLMAMVSFGKETPVTGGVLNALNDAVLAADSGDVLILAAGQIYPNQGSIDVDKDLTIMGLGSIEEANLPYIKEVPAEDGSWASQTIQVLNTFKIYNVFFNGFRGEEFNETNDRCFRINTPVDTVIIEGCVFEQYRKRTVALNKAVDYFKCTNSIFNHNWKISGMDEGRAIDMRNGDHGTVWIENCTFTGSSDRHIRHQKWGSLKAPVVDKLIINQCTFLNSGNYRSSFTFQSVGELTFTNNLAVNNALFGSDMITNRKNELAYLEGSDAVTTFGPDAVCPFVLTEVDSFNTTVVFSNNNIYQEEAVNVIFDGVKVTNPPNFNNEFLTVIDEATASFEEVLTFNNAPAAPLSMITEFVAMVDTITSDGATQPAPTYAAEYIKYDLLDLGYSGGSKSATAATDGGALGDRRWSISVGVEDHLAIESQLKLIQNYPNPFSTSTTVRFMLQEGSDVNVTLYNLVGAKVRMVSDQYYSPGLNEITMDRGNLEAGVYFLQVSSEKATDLIKLTVK